MAKHGFVLTLTKTIHLVVENGKDDTDALKKAKRLGEFFLGYDDDDVEEKKSDIMESKNGSGVSSAGAKGAVTSFEAEMSVDVDEDFDQDSHEEEQDPTDLGSLEDEIEDED